MLASPTIENVAFPSLSPADLALLQQVACCQDAADGEVLFRDGQADVDLFVIKTGQIDILNPADDNKLVVSHGPGQFAGDIDLLTRRPVIVTAVARGPKTELLRVQGKEIPRVLNTIPHIGEILITAFQARREQLQKAGVLGLQVVGPKSCRDTTIVREFLYKNFVPFTWFDTEEPSSRPAWEKMGSPKKTPAIECSDGTILLNPKLQKLAECAGIWRDCPSGETIDLTVIGAGPAGIAAAVYAASEGLKTVVLDRLGPGGQVGGSSMVENFIGFPAGLSGTELATRGVLQMLKFGARMVAPVSVDSIESRPDGSGHALNLSCGATLHTQVVLVATGMHWRKLEALNADKFERQGIYYACTRVEGFVHQGQDVAIVGAGNSAGQAAMFMAEHAARHVHMIVRNRLGPGMSDYLADRIRAQPNITVHEKTVISEVHGSRNIESVTLKSNQDAVSSPTDPASPDTKDLPLSAIFVFIGADPGADFLPKTVARDKLGYLLCGPDAKNSGQWPLKDREPTALETTLPGVLAGGDVRAGSTKRVGFAVGDGSLAVTCAHRIRAALQ